MAVAVAEKPIVDRYGASYPNQGHMSPVALESNSLMGTEARFKEAKKEEKGR